ncbi:MULTISPECIES: hypothetical protein [Photorhabdus]|uniref:Acid shock protein n=2 Tax=Photorhabdus asymbiotica TaxID=291112 RepID=C7BMR1_PHOAA|nr:hypothetical protein [Photorhabdus asymbiotica]RKS59794.1 hypothetical protein BDD30_1883 [Photorhabdus asymbiotica]CAQ85940.1 Hypothetical protein PAU_03852 [Photorhabdus asymbiotica]
MTRLGLSVTVLSFLFSGAVLAAPTTPMTQSSDTQMTSSHMEKKAGQEKQSSKTKTHSNHKVKKEETKKAH